MKDILNKNNNNGLIKKLAARSLKSAKMRNTFTLLTIILSVALISGLALFVFGVRQADKNQLDTMQHVLYQNLSNRQAEHLQSDERIADSLILKSGTRVEVDDYTIQPLYIQQAESTIASQKVTEGSYPEKLNEIAVDQAYMKQIGKAAKLGTVLELQNFDGDTETFRVSGFCDSGSSSRIYSILFSKAYAEKGPWLKDLPYTLGAKIDGAKMMSEDDFLETITDIGADYGVDRANINENAKFTTSLVMNTQEIMTVVIIALFIFFVSIVVIYSIFYISVMSRIRQFGQLRTLGATPRQLKKLVKREGMTMFLIGAPIGLLLGTLFGWFMAPEGWLWINTISVAAVTLAADFFTIMISVRKPAKIAASISPIEAAKASGYTKIKGQSAVLHRKITPFNLARMGIKRDRRKFIVTVFSLCISGIVFMAGATFLSSFDKLDFSKQGFNRYSEYQIWISENTINANAEGLTGVQKNNPLDDALVKKIEAIDGVKKVISQKKIHVDYRYENNQRSDGFVPFTREETKSINKYLADGQKADYDLAVKEKKIYVLSNDTAEKVLGKPFKIGAPIDITWFDGKEKRTDTFTIAGELDKGIYNDDDAYRIVSLAGFFVVPEDTIKHMVKEGFNYNRVLLVDTDWPAAEKQVTAQLTRLVDANDKLSLDTLRQQIKEDEQITGRLTTLFLGLSAFIILFSVINLINTIVTSVMSRRQEFAMLQSIGMGKGQLIKMIQGEGLILALYNILFSLTLGGALGWLIIWALRETGVGYLYWNYPLLYGAGYSLFVILLPLIVSAIAIKMAQSKSIVERLHEAD
ncbi:ABC transporter permease [Emergencia timonensis]|uniref:ABC transporter permease n=1 Tax=Emergencia timonensis TaxID=1776384 RepID=UPI003995AB61